MDRDALLYGLAVFAIYALYFPQYVGTTRVGVDFGVCNKVTRACCTGYFKLDRYCVPCPVGTYGQNCSRLCPTGTYGSSCAKNCTCSNDTCHPAIGCNSKDTTPSNTEFHLSTASSADNVLTPMSSDTKFPLTVVEIAILSALLCLIILAIANIIISKTNVFEVKHDVLPMTHGHYWNHDNAKRGSTRSLNKNPSAKISENPFQQHSTRHTNETEQANNLPHQTRMPRYTGQKVHDGWYDYGEVDSNYENVELNLSPLNASTQNKEYFSFGDL